MAELNWIDKNERLPTAEDASKQWFVYGFSKCGGVRPLIFKTVGESNATHWLPFHEMPVPKRWRVPTIQDLAKAGKPIRCRMRDDPTSQWLSNSLCAIDVSIGETNCRPFFSSHGDWYYFCEICDD